MKGRTSRIGWIRIGVTGGPGMGKSTVARYFEEFGVPVVDTDQLARELVKPGQPAWEEIRRVFGSGVFLPDGSLDRAALARWVFRDVQARKNLEGILHPRIRTEWKQRLERYRSEGKKAAAVLIPLLFETGWERELDVVVCVGCTEETQRERLLKRGWSEEEIRLRNRAQWPVEQKMARADYVIWTEGVLGVTEKQVRRVLQRIGVLGI